MKDISVTAVILAAESPGRVIGFDKSILWGLGFQTIFTLAILGGVVLIIYLGVLAIRALRLYIKKNQK